MIKLVMRKFSLMTLLILLTSSCQEKHSLYNRYKNEIEKQLKNDIDFASNNVTTDDWMIQFLNEEFDTELFSKNKSLRHSTWNGIAKDKKRLHIGIISMLFDSKSDVLGIVSSIKSTGRNSFKIKVYTPFTFKTNDLELVIVYTETYLNPSITPMYKKIVGEFK